MTKVIFGKNPNLSMLIASPTDDFSYPIILDSNNQFYWAPNNYLLKYGGGAMIFGVKPVPSTVKAKALSLGLFLNYLDQNNIRVDQVVDSHIFKYTNHLQTTRSIEENSTVKSNVRVALDYLLYIQELRPDLNLITESSAPKVKFNVHIKLKKHRKYSSNYVDHAAIENLSTLSNEAEMVSDSQYLMWIEAINHTGHHPTPNELTIGRWETLVYLLEATGARISELRDLTRSQIKQAYVPLADANFLVNLKELPIKKGKYKGKCRKVSVPNGTLQRIMDYIYLIESTWPEMAHDNLFVSLIDGSKLSDSYFDKYTEKVISKSIYKDQLIGLSNQSFRHRFITLKIVEKLNQFKNTSNLANCLAIAKKAVRKLTMHANDSTMSHYVHLALEYISEEQQLSSNVAAPERLALISIKETMNKYNHDKCSANQALSSINSAMEKIYIAA